MNLFNVTDGMFIRMNTMLADLSVEETVEQAANGEHLAGADSLEKKTQQLGTTTYSMVFKCIMIGLLIGFLLRGAGLMFSDEQARREKKSQIVWGVAGAAVAVSASAILIFLGKSIPGFLD